eukprot:ANDGO_00219.mRNA.1 hypothetical protein
MGNGVGFFGALSSKQWGLISFLISLNLLRIGVETLVFIRDLTCTLHGEVFISCPSSTLFGRTPVADFLLSILQIIHYVVLFYFFWYWNVWFQGSLCEIRFHLNPTQLIHSRRTFKKLYVKQLTVFEFFSMWCAGVAFLYIVCLAEGSRWYNYTLPLFMALGMFVEIFAIVPMNFSAPAKVGAARYVWFLTLFAIVWSSMLSSVFYSLLVALKVYDPSFFSSNGVHALILVLGGMMINLRLSVFYMMRRKMWNPKANSIMPNLKSVQGHFQDQVNGDLTDAFLYATKENTFLLENRAGGDQFLANPQSLESGTGTGTSGSYGSATTFSKRSRTSNAEQPDDFLHDRENDRETLTRGTITRLHSFENLQTERYSTLC